MSTFGNNGSQEISDVRDECLDAFSQSYLRQLRGIQMASDVTTYLLRKQYKQIKNHVSNLPATEVIRAIETLNFSIENNLIAEEDMPKFEANMAALLDSIEDYHMAMEKEM